MSRAMTFAALVAAVLMTSCQHPTQASPTPPVSPPAGPDVLLIVPALSGLILGATATLTAQVRSGNGASRAVSASWSSDAPDVVSVQSNGQINGVRLGGTTIRATFETLAETLPLRVVPDYSGRWSGWYRVTSCFRLSGGGPDVCRFVEGGRFGLRTTLIADGGNFPGTLELLNNLGDRVVESGEIEGTVDAGNSLVLSGETSTIDPSERGRSMLREWKSTLTADGGEMVGSFIRMWTFQNFWGDQQMKYTCKLEAFQRSKP